MGELKMGFDNGAISLEEWKALDEFFVSRQLYNVVEIGTGFSTYLFSMVADQVLSLDTDQQWLELVADYLGPRKNVDLVKYDYPDFSSAAASIAFYPPQTTLCFVDGPAGHNKKNPNSRRDSMILAKNYFKYIAIHDSRRQGEANNIAELFTGDWSLQQSARSLALLQRGDVKNV